MAKRAGVASFYRGEERGGRTEMHDGLVGLCCHCDCWLCAVDLERRIEDGEEDDEETAGRH